MTNTSKEYWELEATILKLPEELRERLFRRLRQEFAIHPLEARWNTTAEDILEAISRGSDLTHRGIRGMLAEASFASNVIEKLESWKDFTPPGDHTFDFLLADSVGSVRIRVKNQRLEGGKPLVRRQKYFKPVYIVETQKTRSGQDSSGEKTRPYRFGEFDILAVCLYPSTGRWDTFLYTVANWLLPHERNNAWIATFQPIPMPPEPNDVWTDDLEAAIAWLRSGASKTVMPD